MTRPSTIKRPRLAQGHSLNTSPTTLSALPTASVSNLSSRSSTASATTVVTGISTGAGASATSISGVPPNTTSSSTRPSPPQHQHHFPVQHPYPAPPKTIRDSRHTPSSLSIPTPSTIAHHTGAHGGHNTTASNHHMPQHSGSGAVPAPSPTSTNPSAPYQQSHPDRYPHPRQQDQDLKPPVSSGHYMNTQSPNTSLPPLTSPIGPPPGHSASAPPFVTHPPPLGDHYQQRGHYPAPNPNIPPTTPISGGFVDRQQSAPVGAPHQVGMAMEHPPQHHGYGPPPHSMDAPVNGVPTSIHGPNGMYQPTAGYPPPSPHHGPPAGGYYADVPPHYQHAPTSQWPQAPPQPQQKAAVKKNSRAHVACNNCRTRKQKCDETPSPPGCSYCVQEGLECIYREVAQPKVDRNIATLQEKVELHTASLETQSEKMDRMGRDIASLLELLKTQQQHSRGPATNGTPVIHTELSEQASTLATDDDEQTGTIKESAPGAHSTGAQHLSKKFPMTERWFKAVGIETCEIYPYELESGRGTPRIFGSGWSGDDSNPRGPEGNANYSASYAQNSYEKFNKGGINPNGSLRLDSVTVKRLHDSYMRHMWVIYPILNAEELKQRISTFCALYSPDDDVKPATPPGPPYNAHSPHGSNGMKRSFSQMNEMHQIQHDPGHAASPKRPVDFSLNNAIILLVLALGKLCEHNDYIMEGEIPKPDPFPMDGSASQGSSPNDARPVSTRSTNSSSSPKYPNQIMNVNHSFGYNNASAKNVEKLPGLAYYAEAAAILGHCIGRRGLDAVHAYILVGLYWGQMGFVLQAADWIHMGGNAIIEVLHTLPAEDITVSPDTSRPAPWKSQTLETQNKLDLFLISFWTLQQMEGDILAELERLAPSRLGTHQQINGLDVRIPSGLVGVGSASHPYALFNGNLELSNVALHFSSQLTLRIYLNRAHLALYSTDQQKEAAINKQRELTWADLKPEHLWDTVQGWRRGLPAALSWYDDQEPSSDILQARLRAKYYGFVYIVSRKILEDVAKHNGPIDGWVEYARLKDATLEELGTEGMKNIGVACKRCILAAMASTIAFDNTCDRTRQRARLPNIMGTFTAQFSNVLILSYCYLDPRLRPLIPNEQVIIDLLQRTIRVLNNLSPMSPVFRANKEILLKAYEDVAQVMANSGHQVPLAATAQRLNANPSNNWSTPNYGSPGVHSLSQGPNTPQDHYTTSATTSFNTSR